MEMKLRRNKANNQFSIALPKLLVTDILKWKEGDEISYDIDKRESGARVLILKKKVSGEL